MQNAQISRQWQILRDLEINRNGLTAAQIAKTTGVSLRTTYRDLENLEKAGFPLYSKKDDKARRWRFLESYHFNIPHLFAYTELMSLHMSRDMLGVFKGTAFFDSLESAFQKIERAIPPQFLTYLDRIRTTFQVGINPYKDYHRYRNIIDTINKAALEYRRLEMLYLPLRSKKETHRKIDPYGIRIFDGTIYFIGYCHLRNDVRTFVVDRIRLLKLTRESFKRPTDFDLEKYSRHSFKVVHDQLYEIKIRISPQWARYVGEKTWHQSQRVKKNTDKSLEMTFRVAGLAEIKQWVLSWGAEAEVVSPNQLKEMVKKDLRKSLLNYMAA